MITVSAFKFNIFYYKEEVPIPMHKYMIAVHGPRSSGATQLSTKLLGKPYNDNNKFIIDMVKIIYSDNKKNEKIQLQYWDFAPLNSDKDTQEQYLSKIKTKLSKMHKICITFDASDPNWMETLNTYLSDNKAVLPFQFRHDSGTALAVPALAVPVILVGTKVDLLSSEQRAVLELQAKVYAQLTLKTEHFMLVSAKSGSGIDELKSCIIADLDPLVDVTKNDEIGNKIPSLGSVQRLSGMPQDEDPEDPDDPKISCVEDSLFSSEDQIPLNLTPASRNLSNNALSLPLTPISSHCYPIGQRQQNVVSGAKVPQPRAGSEFSFALRMVGLALMVAAVVNLVYLALIAANVLSAVALTTAMSHVLATAGGILCVTAPAVAFANACAAWGISTTAATTMIAAASTMLVGLAGYGVFRCGKPAASTQDQVNEQSPSPYNIGWA
jgi:GTPase SAR1 family protein